MSAVEIIKAEKLEFLIPRNGIALSNELLARNVASKLGFRSQNTFRAIQSSSRLLDQREFYVNTTSWGHPTSVLSIFDKYVTHGELKKQLLPHYTFLAIACYNALNNDTDGNQFIIFERGLFIHAAPIDREQGTIMLDSVDTVYKRELNVMKRPRLDMKINETVWENARIVFLARLQKLSSDELGNGKMARRAKEMLDNFDGDYYHFDNDDDDDKLSYWLNETTNNNYNVWKRNHDMCKSLSIRFLYEKVASNVFEAIFPLPNAHQIVNILENVAKDFISRWEREESVYDFSNHLAKRLNADVIKLRFKRTFPTHVLVFADNKERFVEEQLETYHHDLYYKSGFPDILMAIYNKSFESGNLVDLREYAIVHELKIEPKLGAILNLLRKSHRSLQKISRKFQEEMTQIK